MGPLRCTGLIPASPHTHGFTPPSRVHWTITFGCCTTASGHWWSIRAKAVRLDYLATHHLVLETILVTHHHHDRGESPTCIAAAHRRWPATEWLVNQPPACSKALGMPSNHGAALAEKLDVPGHRWPRPMCEQVA